MLPGIGHINTRNSTRQILEIRITYCYRDNVKCFVVWFSRLYFQNHRTSLTYHTNTYGRTRRVLIGDFGDDSLASWKRLSVYLFNLFACIKHLISVLAIPKPVFREKSAPED